MAQRAIFCAGKMNILLSNAGSVVRVDKSDLKIASIRHDQGAAFRGTAPGTGEGAGVQQQPGTVGREVRHMGVAIEDHVSTNLLAPVQQGVQRIVLVAVL
jgi:hypothetical protein